MPSKENLNDAITYSRLIETSDVDNGIVGGDACGNFKGTCRCCGSFGHRDLVGSSNNGKF